MAKRVKIDPHTRKVGCSALVLARLSCFVRMSIYLLACL